jgi:hypothetical protein
VPAEVGVAVRELELGAVRELAGAVRARELVPALEGERAPLPVPWAGLAKGTAEPLAGHS